jgi:hypothetical protein
MMKQFKRTILSMMLLFAASLFLVHSSNAQAISVGPFHQNTDGTLTQFPWDGTYPMVNCAVGCSASASVGTSVLSTIIPNNTTAIVVKASAGTLYAIDVTNNSATIAYINVYNAISATCGSGTPLYRTLIPASTSGISGAPFRSEFLGEVYSTGITYCVHTGFGDTDNTAPAAGTYIVNVHYK